MSTQIKTLTYKVYRSLSAKCWESSLYYEIRILRFLISLPVPNTILFPFVTEKVKNKYRKASSAQNLAYYSLNFQKKKITKKNDAPFQFNTPGFLFIYSAPRNVNTSLEACAHPVDKN